MRRAMCLVLLMALAACGGGSIPPAAEQQTLVDRATLTAQEMLGQGDPGVRQDTQGSLRRSRAVMICPRVLKAGFILGAQGGSCVLTARDGAGSWSSPAFYSFGSGSLGLQIGLQDAQLMFFILTDKGLNAVLDNQVKLGGDISIALVTVGGGMGGATTTAAGADVVAYAKTRGLYAGITLDGAVMSPYHEGNQAYYGRPVAVRDIVLSMTAYNQGADPLRAVLMQYGASQAVVPPSAQPYAAPAQGSVPGAAPYGQAAPPAYSAPVTGGGITRETLH